MTLHVVRQVQTLHIVDETYGAGCGCLDTEGGHCQGACRPQWFFYVPLQVSETAPPFNVVMRATRATQSPMLKGEK